MSNPTTSGRPAYSLEVWLSDLEGSFTTKKILIYLSSRNLQNWLPALVELNSALAETET